MSFSEAGVATEREVETLADEGLVAPFDSWEAVLRLWSRAKATKVAAIVERRPQGGGDVAVGELAPPPRVGDAVAQVLAFAAVRWAIVQQRQRMPAMGLIEAVPLVALVLGFGARSSSSTSSSLSEGG